MQNNKSMTNSWHDRVENLSLPRSTAIDRVRFSDDIQITLIIFLDGSNDGTIVQAEVKVTIFSCVLAVTQKQEVRRSSGRRQREIALSLLSAVSKLHKRL